MAIHELKTWIEPFTAVLDGKKTAEFRVDDRGFQDGDTLVLREWDHEASRYTGRCLTCAVTDVRRGGQFGIPQGYAMLSIRYWLNGDFRTRGVARPMADEGPAT